MGFFSRSKKPDQGPPAPGPRFIPHNLGPGLGSPPPLPPPSSYPVPQAWPTQYQSAPPPPIIVNQHYHFTPSPPPPRLHYASAATAAASKLKLGSVVDLASEAFDEGISRCQGYGSQMVGRSSAVVDDISASLSDVLTMIDCDRYRGNERALFVYQQPPLPLPQQQMSQLPPPPVPSHDTAGERSLGFASSSGKKKDKKDRRQRDHPKAAKGDQVATIAGSGHYFSKVDLYANSRLPMNLPPLKLYMPTYPLLCLAAQYSERVYARPNGPERAAHVDSSWLTGTKAMVIKSVPMDDVDTIVFAIRGTATFADWAVNLHTAPASPGGFLDDAGNLCHAGFLSVARKTVPAVAARLRQLLEEDPRRASSSLLITGHSAGGAVAALLYCHMLSTSAESELTALAGVFRRVHCVTFGAPPVSLLPLQKPAGRPELKKSLFLSFVNEGDPVCRADRAYVRSLLDLFAAPAPSAPSVVPKAGALAAAGLALAQPHKSKSKASLASNSSSGKKKRSPSAAKPIWPVPDSVLSNAGRIVVLRSGTGGSAGKKTVEQRLDEGVVAQVATDEQLRTVIWGDPVCHVMRLYAGRIETLAVGAVTAQGDW